MGYRPREARGEEEKCGARPDGNRAGAGLSAFVSIPFLVVVGLVVVLAVTLAPGRRRPFVLPRLAFLFRE